MDLGGGMAEGKANQGPLHWLHNSCGNVITLLSHVVCGSKLV